MRCNPKTQNQTKTKEICCLWRILKCFLVPGANQENSTALSGGGSKRVSELPEPKAQWLRVWVTGSPCFQSLLPFFVLLFLDHTQALLLALKSLLGGSEDPTGAGH